MSIPELTESYGATCMGSVLAGQSPGELLTIARDYIARANVAYHAGISCQENLGYRTAVGEIVAFTQADRLRETGKPDKPQPVGEDVQE